MPEKRNLECRRLTEADGELLAGLLAMSRAGAEAFGLNQAGRHGATGAWGVFIQGVLCGAAGLAGRRSGREAEIAFLLVSDAWRNAGVSLLLLDALVREAGEGGAREVLARLADGPRSLGEILADAGFSGPSPKDDAYPAGEWRRGAESR
ncbi:MAG: GNAT family N-acetyltransferase [Planctomycetota bacterium]|jgi:GNAT superfamily N-acetyltransferase|nr:GNAT family N-acetyltransferase [Planctomycetota bacterium]